ncbi:MAG TPA: trypsin-like peptidase domain-containing protein [Bacillota bacterium]|nr:trypsin-like peptidase domain-containing protein [Bacillota bacterium]
MKKIMIPASVVILTFFSGAVFASNGAFKDVETGYWAANAIEHLSDLGIIHGYKDGTFKPDDYVTRAEVASMIDNLHNSMQKNGSQSSTSTVESNSEENVIINTVANATPSVVMIEVPTSDGTALGTGFFVDPTHILTAAHVIGDGNEASIEKSNGTRYKASVVKMDQDKDLALLKVDPSEAGKPILFASSYTVGQTVIAIGNPEGLSYSVSRGIVSNTDRVLNEGSVPFIQFDSLISPGNSGGPLLDSKGKLIGLVDQKLIGNGVEGIGFAIRVDDIKEFLNS